MTEKSEDVGAFERVRTVVDFAEVLRGIWRQKVIFLAVLVFSFLACVFYLHVVKFAYTVILQVTAVEDQTKQVKGSLSDLASAAGIALPGGGGERQDSFELFLQNIYSRQTADDLAKDQSLMRAMYPREWDAQTRQWHSADGALRAIVTVLKYLFGVPVQAWEPPNGMRVQQFIVRNVRISRDFKSPVVTIEMSHDNPDFGKWFLSQLHHVDDGRLRQRALARTSKYIDYLNVEITKVTNDEYRKALIDLLSDQEKRRMFASSSSIAYAAEPFESATSSALPTSPSPSLLLILSAAIGTLIGGFAAFYWDNSRRRPGRGNVPARHH